MDKTKFYIDLSKINSFHDPQSQTTNKNFSTTQKLSNNELEIEIQYSDHITEEQMNAILSSKKFNDYIRKIDLESVLIRNIKILNVYMFGKNVGFIGLEVDCSLKTHLDKKLPGYVFIRGKSVGIFVLINNQFMVLTRQFRIPVGKFMLEIPAGMLDESGDFCGVAAKELEEEIGVKINQKELIYLTSMYPSCGGSDEEIIFYSLNLKMEPHEIEELKNKTFGEENSHEIITLKILELNYENIMQTKDAKLITAAFAAQNQLGLNIPDK